jgi:murein L,D-transpeptidase YcbB/YkuD
MKALFRKLTSKGALVLALVVVVSLFTLLLTAVFRDAEISFSKAGVVTIVPKGNKRIEQLEKLLNNSVSKDEHQRLRASYDHLYDEWQIARSRVTRLLAAAGADLSKGEDVAVRAIEMLAARHKQVQNDMYVCLATIRNEVNVGRTINTNSSDMNETRCGLYMDIQKFLTCVGAYTGRVDGNQPCTCNAVKEFQRKSGLSDDGIIGRKTFRAMERAFEDAKSH